jgi:hypothetical protein
VGQNKKNAKKELSLKVEICRPLMQPYERSPLDPRGLDLRELDPRGLDLRELDPRELDPRELDLRELDLWSSFLLETKRTHEVGFPKVEPSVMLVQFPAVMLTLNSWAFLKG